MFTICLSCTKQFNTFPSRIKRGRDKYCSKNCTNIGHKGKQNSPTTQFKKGQIPWNKNKEFFQIKAAKHFAWKDDKVGYVALHQWIARQKGRNNICELCNRRGKTHMANIDYKYSRDLETWQELCPSCHEKYDIKNGWRNGKKAFLERRVAQSGLI